MLVLTFINNTYSQTEIQRKLLSPTFLSIVEYRSWEKDIGESTQSVSQISSPTAIKLPLSRNLAIDIAGSYMFSSVENSELKGLTDVRTRAVAMLFDDRIMLNGGINIPNGKSDLGIEETAVSAILSDKALGFKYNSLGQGLDFTFGGGFAQAFGSASFGIGAGYIIKGEYEIAKDQEIKYKPGDQLNITGGFDLLFSPLLLRTDATYTTYQSDKSEGEEIFKEGNRLAIEESAIVSNEAYALAFSGRYVNRSKSEITNQAYKDSLFFVPEIQKKKLYGDQISANGLVNFRLAQGFYTKVLAESTIITKNEDKKNGATVFGFGGGITIKSEKGSFLDLIGKYYIGQLSSENKEAKTGEKDQKTDLKGFSVTSSIRIIF
jgi:hypothetical protein